MLREQDVHREVLKWSRMNGGRGTVVLLRDPGLENLGKPCPERCPRMPGMSVDQPEATRRNRAVLRQTEDLESNF